MAYILSCCSTADLSREHFESRDIHYICFHFFLDGKAYPDDLGESIPFDKFYAAMANGADTRTSQINTVWYDTCLPQIADANILPAQESAPAMLVALNSGRCDLVVTDMPTAMAACVAYPNFKLLDFSGTDGDFEVSEEEINIGISIRKGNAALCEAINGVLATMTVDDYTAMMNDAIAVQPLSE